MKFVGIRLQISAKMSCFRQSSYSGLAVNADCGGLATAEDCEDGCCGTFCSVLPFQCVFEVSSGDSVLFSYRTGVLVTVNAVRIDTVEADNECSIIVLYMKSRHVYEEP